MKNNTIAIIPLRKGSKSIKDKNIYRLGKFKYPLCYYVINSAILSDIEKVVITTDSDEYIDIINDLFFRLY